MLGFVKDTFVDVSKLYKNFWHFTLSKIVIFIISIGYAFLVSIPFLIIFGIFYYYFYSLSSVSVFGDQYYLVIFFLILLFLSFVIIFAAFTFYYPLLIRLDLEYIKDKKLKLSKNYYFDFKFFINYLKLFLLNVFIILSPFLAGIILFLFIVILYGGFGELQLLINGNNARLFYSITFVIFIASIIFFLYFLYKTIFAIVIFVDRYKRKKDFKSPMYYIRKSFKLTKGFKKALKFIFLFIILGIISLPIEIPSDIYYNKIIEIRDYKYFDKNPEELDDRNSGYFFNYLEKKYGKLSSEKIENILYTNYAIYSFIQVLYFLFIVGLFEMILVSFYKRQLKK